MIQTLKTVNEDVLAQIEEEKKIRKTDELFLLFSLGSQFNHLIKQELEKLGVFCLIADPSSITCADVRKVAPMGIILSGGPSSVHVNSPTFDKAIFDIGIPVFGICLGFQMWANHVGCDVIPAENREFGIHDFTVSDNTQPLVLGLVENTVVLESHGDKITTSSITPASFIALGSTEHTPIAAAQYKHLYGVQFHPEVTETTCGQKMFENFCFRICGAKDRYPAVNVAQQKIEEIREQIGDRKVLLALSGGSDSSVLASLLMKATGGKQGRVRAVYIKGIDRPDDEEHVIKYFNSQSWLDVDFVDATDEFLRAVHGITSMHKKRVAMRGVYREILEKKAKEYGASFIAQGTLYTDICESGGGYDTGARKAIIKLHHNTDLEFSLPELTPLDDCVKDGARSIGRAICVPEDLLTRHPFPGPGLLVRIEGEVTRENLAIARKADSIYIEELRKWGLYNTVWQAGAVVTNSIVTCTKGDDATTGIVIRLWAVWSVNGFTARAAELPWEFIKRVSKRITNEIPQVGSVDYRISDKPPATIECG